MNSVHRVLTAVVLFLMAPVAAACGTMDHWIDAFNGTGPIQEMNRKTALIGIYECARFHYEESDDTRLLKVLAEAHLEEPLLDQMPNTMPTDGQQKYSGTGSTSRLIADIYTHYGCLMNAEARTGYRLPHVFDEVKAACGSALTYVEVAAGNGLNARLKPGGRKLGAFRPGTRLIKVAEESGYVMVLKPVEISHIDSLGLVYVSAEFLKSVSD